MFSADCPGSIIVGHANGRGWHTAAALPLLISKLRTMGYGFVTVSKLIARGKPEIAASCYNSHPGDTDRYDFLGQLHATSVGSWTATISSVLGSPQPKAKAQRAASKKSRAARRTATQTKADKSP